MHTMTMTINNRLKFSLYYNMQNLNKNMPLELRKLDLSSIGESNRVVITGKRSTGKTVKF